MAGDAATRGLDSSHNKEPSWAQGRSSHVRERAWPEIFPLVERGGGEEKIKGLAGDVGLEGAVHVEKVSSRRWGWDSLGKF